MHPICRYLYPFQTHGFTDWVTKENRPIIVHGIGKKAGKLINGATELFAVGLRRCVDMFAGTGWTKVGFYSCHHVADSQGFKFEPSGIIRSVSAGIHKCMDASNLKVSVWWVYCFDVCTALVITVVQSGCISSVARVCAGGSGCSRCGGCCEVPVQESA